MGGDGDAGGGSTATGAAAAAAGGGGTTGGSGGGNAAAAAVLDAARAERPVWLLKVPTVVNNVWQKEGDGSQALAKITLTLDPLNPNPQNAVQFKMELKGKESAEIPKGYDLNFTKDMVPMHIFSENPQGKLATEGKVEHKFDMKPNSMVDDEYRKLCRERLNKSREKTRTLQVLQNDRGSFMRPLPMQWPVAGPKDKKKVLIPAKGPEGKRIRRERNELEDIVFKLFERQPNWALKQLVQETDQPVAFLKEVLNDLCVYNKRGANQGTYELKPEYKLKTAEEEKPAV
ncbi:hypothetical protein O6H91_Y064900 [Diphasiastrum complanatum]|nr:hypothetical protein O6H91_Y163700 [Diphasiastrum complanatum]KAJ7297319.1 hypothetical protein O6H91_Y064900 [Diphasiastrum complanatum]